MARRRARPDLHQLRPGPPLRRARADVAAARSGPRRRGLPAGALHAAGARGDRRPRRREAGARPVRLLAAAALLTVARAALAAPPAAPAPPSDRAEPPASLAVNGVCPNPEALWAAISSLVPGKELDRLGAAKVEVSDLGDTYRVAVSAKGIDRLRVYRDLGHDCDHRARFAAVFIVLTLMPPDVLIEKAPPPPEPAP